MPGPAPGLSAFWASGKTKRPFVTTFHGTYNFGGPLKRWYNSIMSRGERVIAISSFIARHLRQFYGTPNRKIRVIHRGVNLRRFDPAAVSARRMVALANDWRLGDGLPVIMLPGRLTHGRAGGFRRPPPNWAVTSAICSSAPGARAISRVGKHGAPVGVVGRGSHHRPLRRHARPYMLADVVVSASTDPEAFGRVVAGQALGRPVVVSDHGGPSRSSRAKPAGW